MSPAAFANALFDRWWLRALLEAWRVLTVHGLPIVLAAAVCIAAARRGAPLLWPSIGVFVILFLSFCGDILIVPPPGPDQLAEIGGSIGFGTDRLVSIRVLRLLVPLMLVLGPYYWWRNRQQNYLSG